MLQQTFVFRCLNGFGNKLCNLMNMFYIHDQIPQATILLDWVMNEHCQLDIADIIDLTPYPWIRRADGRRPPPGELARRTAAGLYTSYAVPGELWASTSVEPTRWDSLEEWKRHRSLVSISFHLYRFVPMDFCRQTFAAFKFHPAILARMAARGPGRPLVHVRSGDLQRLIENSVDPTVGERLRTTIAGLDPLVVSQYTADTLQRGPDQIREAVADLLWMSRVCTIRGYCPYSHFSSWVFVLSAQWNPQKPIFDYRKAHLEMLT